MADLPPIPDEAILAASAVALDMGSCTEPPDVLAAA